MWVRVTAPMALLVLAAGCSGDAGGPAEASYAQRLSDAEAMVERVTNDSFTPDSEIPAAGTATYEGYTAVNLEGAVEGSLIGDTTIVANFSNDSLTGRADNFFGRVDGGRTQDYAGSLAITDGEIGGLRRNSVIAAVEGRLTGDGHRIGVDSVVVGGFSGEDASGLALAGLGGRATVDGVRQDVEVAVVGER